MDKKRLINRNEVHFHPKYSPQIDKEFVIKYQEYLTNKLPIYLAVIPSDYVKPYDLNYYPFEWEPFKQLMIQTKEQIEKDKYPVLDVYQHGRFFIMPDDYPTYYAYLECKNPFMVCRVYGKPNHDKIEIHSGPHLKNDKV